MLVIGVDRRFAQLGMRSVSQSGFRLSSAELSCVGFQQGMLNDGHWTFRCHVSVQVPSLAQPSWICRAGRVSRVALPYRRAPSCPIHDSPTFSNVSHKCPLPEAFLIH